MRSPAYLTRCGRRDDAVPRDVEQGQAGKLKLGTYLGNFEEDHLEGRATPAGVKQFVLTVAEETWLSCS